MKAAVVRDPYGIENLSIEEVEEPAPRNGEIPVRIKMGSLNPIDFTVTANRPPYKIRPTPHIIGSEVFGIAEADGESIKKGDRVLIYPRINDGTCENCLSDMENMCLNGGVFGVASNGAFCERIAIGERYLFKIEDNIPDNVAASLTVGGLTAYHALQRAHVRGGQKILIYGASGNTGIFAVQIAKSIGLEVHAVSGKNWITDYGADFVYSADSVPENFRADVIINSLGNRFWSDSISHLSHGGTLVTFGMLTGADASVKISQIYTQELSVKGSTGGTRKELKELIGLTGQFGYRAPVHEKYSLAQLKEAMEAFSSREKGRILIEM